MFGRLLGKLLRPIRGTARAPESGTTQADEANPLAEYFYNNPGQAMTKWHNYLEIYHRHFAGFRGRSPVVVEIGVELGGSLQMWHHYFGPGTRLVGIDIDTRCLELQDDATTIMIGDQADRSFLAAIRERVPHIDILIDDGGHMMTQQITTFEELYPSIQPNGIYLCEDMHTSLWPAYGGGYRRPGTFLEYSKALVDKLSAWHSESQPALPVDEFTRTTHSMHFYDSVVVIEKRPMKKPRQFRTASDPSIDS
jgi:hypothetical protein